MEFGSYPDCFVITGGTRDWHNDNLWCVRWLRGGRDGCLSIQMLSNQYKLRWCIFLSIYDVHRNTHSSPRVVMVMTSASLLALGVVAGCGGLVGIVAAFDFKCMFWDSIQVYGNLLFLVSLFCSPCLRRGHVCQIWSTNRLFEYWG